MLSLQQLNRSIFGRTVIGSAAPARPRGLAHRRLRWLKWAAPALIVFSVAGYELRTSGLQARVFSSYAAASSFTVESGRSDEIAFPTDGPFDQFRGYTEIPQFIDRLAAAGYRVTEQARVSPELLRLMKWGIPPPYPEPAGAGLRIRAHDGELLYNSGFGRRTFQTFNEIPANITQALLFIENRELELEANSSVNPAIEWDRLGWAGLLYAGRKAGLSIPVEGGSTLAVQLEKYRHSPNGRTGSASDKLRQILGASLRVYRSGPNTQEERQKIVLEYLNTLPLAGQAGYGEVHGLGEGLHAWFGLDLDQVVAMLSSEVAERRGYALKHVLALLCSVRAPSHYLVSQRDALETRVRYYTHLMEENGMLPATLAEQVRRARLSFLTRAPAPVRVPYTERKEIDSTRTYLQQVLGVRGLYDLDRLHLQVDTPIDARLQEDIRGLLKKLHDPEFVDKNGLRGDRLLANGKPEDVVYSVTLFERTPQGNLLRAQADTLNSPFDLNQGMKMELGSTAKLRTTAHYLELAASLHGELTGLESGELSTRRSAARDPLTQWAIETVTERPDITLQQFLDLALDRKYSANPGEAFFTGGGLHTFGNFDDKDGGQILTLREAFRRSTNLVFIRLMRDLVRFHQARLPYDMHAVLEDPDHPVRRQLLEEAADAESTQILARALKDFRGLSEKELVQRVLGSRVNSTRHLSMLFFGWNPDAGAGELRSWLEVHKGGSVSEQEAEKMLRSYDPARLNLLDYGYLLDRHPLEVWCAGQLAGDSKISWAHLLSGSREPRRIVSTWLFQTKNRKAQDLRLRIRIERDAFKRMTPAWQNLGFPFERLVPSLATAIGSSTDRPIALAELVGIILNDGVRRPLLRVTGLRAAAGTPYETALEPVPDPGEQVMAPEIAQTLRQMLAGVVENGTAQRLAGAFVLPDGTRIIAGGKTGSGDNRHDTFTRSGHVTSSRAINRTATFVFYVGDRYFGAITAHVAGRAAERYRFTSALPVTVLKMLAPSLNARLESAAERQNSPSHGFQPLDQKLTNENPVGPAHCGAPTGLACRAQNLVHGLKPVAGNVSPLRGVQN
jgi:membrane peptidoglycan carboxypeptidase